MRNRKMESGELNHRQTHVRARAPLKFSCVIDDAIPPADLWPLTSDLLSSDQTLVSLEAHLCPLSSHALLLSQSLLSLHHSLPNQVSIKLTRPFPFLLLAAREGQLTALRWEVVVGKEMGEEGAGEEVGGGGL